MSENKSKPWVIILVVFVALVIGVVGGLLIGMKSSAPDQMVEVGEPEGQQLYSCGMHPDIIRDEPGNCPICGMKLTPIKTAFAGTTVPQGERKIKYWRAPMDPTYISDKPGKSPMGMDLVPVYEDEIAEGTITIDPVTVQNMGLRTASVKTGKLTRTIRTVGHIDYDEKRLYVINAKITGWIEKLYVNTTGERVHKDQPLLEIYSPDLVSTQEEYLSAVRNYKELKDSPYEDARKGALELLNSTRKRLDNWDIDESQIENLEQSGEIKKTLTLYSPATGVVLHKNAVEGAHVKAGSDLFRIADLSTVWVLAHIYEYELPYVKLGQKARMNLPYMPGEFFEGKVDYIYPYLNQKTRDVKLRLEFPNPGYEIKPEMYATVVIESELAGEKILIPEEAVIRSGKREIVFVDMGEGKFAHREITTGVSGEGNVVEVKKGLMSGEIIVVSGQFMLDSESKTQEAIQKMIKTKMDVPPKTEEHVHPVADTGKEEENHEHEQGEVENHNLTPDKKAHHAEEVYSCPMDEHSHILQVGPGECPQCGMYLVPITETGRPVYTCPMPEHHHILSNRPSDCPECGMRLIELESKAEEEERGK
jgi:Cu(I)/Ag(I) efflux system membrane fusion protein/cobalt-zinc-cadmium efflux system membrane fusion protein